MDRGAKVVIIGDEEDARLVNRLLSGMLANIRRGRPPELAEVDQALTRLGREKNQPETEMEALAEQPAALRPDIRIRPLTPGQKEYLDTIGRCEITLVTGPAGTGKTYLAMAAAVSALLSKRVQRLILTRPAVEAGESLGFLPGDLEEKVNPYLRPLYDALYSMVDLERVRRLVEQQRIEVAPLAFMRGRTLDKAFVILDEAQNTTSDQMLMFLTRLGMGSRAVITGDVTQQDLPRGTLSGLVEAHRILRPIPGIGTISLTNEDVVRNPLVQRIVNAYETESARRAEREAEDRNQTNA